MKWETYKKLRFRQIVEGTGHMPGRKETIRNIMKTGDVWKIEDILPIFCSKTGIDVDSAREHLPYSLKAMIERGIIMELTPGYYRLIEKKKES